MPHTCHYIPEDEVKMINRRYKICSVILVVLALLFAGSLGFYMYRVIARIHGLENDLIQLNHDLDEVRALGTQVIGQILQPEHHFDEESDEQLPLIRKTIRRTIRKTIRKVMKKMAKKHGCDIKDDVVKDLMDQLTNRNSTTKVPSSLINTVTNRKTGELYDVDHTGDGFTLLHRYRPSDGAVVDSQFWNDNAGMDIEARLKKRTNRRLEELQSTTEIYDDHRGRMSTHSFLDGFNNIGS